MRSAQRRPSRSRSAITGRPLREPRTALPGLGALLSRAAMLYPLEHMTTDRGRIAPAAAPFVPEIQAALDRIMPPGVPPLLLFTTLARNPRVFQRFMAGGLLDA